MAPNNPDAARVLGFWLGELDARGHANPEYSQRWWRHDTDFDAEIAERFSALHQAIVKLQRESWLEAPRSRLAYVIVLDQFSRNMFRDTPGMFAHDAQALAAAKEGRLRGHDRELATDARAFMYLPFMHSESLGDQSQCVSLFTELRAELPAADQKSVDNNIKFAIQHRDIIERFGRFPHRNVILGRQSSAAEKTFLTQPGSSF